MKGIIGERIVVYLDRSEKLRYLSKKENNGAEDQIFTALTFPYRIGVECFKAEIKGGYLYKYYLPIEWNLGMLKLAGVTGFINSVKELDSICEIVQGKTEKGEKIYSSRSVRIEDINEIAGVKVDIDNKLIFEEKNPEVNINTLQEFGAEKRFSEDEFERLKKVLDLQENMIRINAYDYKLDSLDIKKGQRMLISNDDSAYYLASKLFGTVDTGAIYLGCNSVKSGIVGATCKLYLDWTKGGLEHHSNNSVRPVICIRTRI